MNQLQAQVSTLTDRLNEMTTKQSAATSQPAAALDAQTSAEAPANITEARAVTPSRAPAAKPAPAKRATTKRHTPADERYAKLQTQLTEQQKKLNDMREQVEKNRSDLEGNINSTRDDLNGSIAKTHEGLVALEQRGERNYVEFDLTKSKQFQRIGPLPLSLRKTDAKHKKYDLALIVEDNELSEKQVNLYEPIRIHTENGAQPAMVVVNRIEKNLVHGYISPPKYMASELATANGGSVTPVSGKSPDSNSTQIPQQPQ
jgi:uncharacterized coiled-coil protein SlyX